MSSKFYRFQISGNNITRIEEFDDGRWELDSQDSNETWSYNPTTNIVTKVEVNPSYTETYTFTDVDNDGVFIRASSVYSGVSNNSSSSSNNSSNSSDDNNSSDLYRFEFSGANVSKIEEFERGVWRLKSRDSNETWSYNVSTNTVTKVEIEDGGYTKTYTYTDSNNDGVFVKSSSVFSDGTSTRNILFGNFSVNGTDDDDYIESKDDDDYLYGGSGDDRFNSGRGNDDIDGGAGDDSLVFNISRSEVNHISKLKNGGYIISSSEGDDTIRNIENLIFLDDSTNVTSLLAAKTAPTITVDDDVITLSTYTGPVSFLEFEYLGKSAGEIAIGSRSNDFMNLLQGDDAADGGLGDDVLDGGIGSNFLTGGGGDDTFFLDGRSASSTWSTITDFTAGINSNGDNINIFGWQEGVSRLLLTNDDDGAEGFKGLTLHYDLDNDGNIDTSITLTGLTTDSMPNITVSQVENTGYLLIS
jgi:Ca2+-binding RTX toxin-like protein